MASEDDPLKALCSGDPVVPALADINTTKDKGLKDPRSFTQQLFNTVTLKMVEWIGLPSPDWTFGPRESGEIRGLIGDHALSSPPEPPKFKVPSNPMDVMDTGRLSRDSEPVTQVRHQEILRKRSNKEIASTPHSNTAKTKLSTPVNPFVMPSPPPLQANFQRPRIPTVQLTPSRGGDKNATNLWEPPEYAAPPKSLNVLNEEICKALGAMCSSSKLAVRKEAKKFAKQSIFYVFSTPKALLTSFGGIGPLDNVGFNPRLVSNALDVLHAHGSDSSVKRSMWTGLANVFAQPGKGMSDKEAAGMIVLALHVLESILMKDEGLFCIVIKLRSSGRVTSGKGFCPDIGFEDDELAERLIKRVLRAIAFRRSRPGDNTVSYVKEYFAKCERIFRHDRETQLAREYGVDIAREMNKGNDSDKGGIGLLRCTLEWTKVVFMRNWDGHTIIKRDSMAGICVEMMELLYLDRESFGLSSKVFESKMIGERFDSSWPITWFNNPLNSTTHINIIDRPYLISVPHRVTFFRMINLEHMRRAFENVIASIRMAGQMSELTKITYAELTAKMNDSMMIYYIIHVRRSNILQDTLNQLVHRQRNELLRPMKIIFEGEEGIDQGGVGLEFFSMLMGEIMKPEYGVFFTDDRTRLSWFWEGSLESTKKFELVGLLMGLAVYNGVTIPVNFPKALYIKLIGGTPTLDDLDDYWPELSRGLKDLLAWEDGDVGDVFVRTYEYSYSVFGQVRSVNMIDAKKHGPEFLPRPVPTIKTKEKAPRNTAPVARTASARDWLNVSTQNDDGWLGGLGEMLDSLVEAQESEARLRRFHSGETRYTVSYHDLNAPEESAEQAPEGGITNPEQILDGQAGSNSTPQEPGVQGGSEGSSGIGSDNEMPLPEDQKDAFAPEDSESEKSWQTEDEEGLVSGDSSDSGSPPNTRVDTPGTAVFAAGRIPLQFVEAAALSETVSRDSVFVAGRIPLQFSEAAAPSGQTTEGTSGSSTPSQNDSSVDVSIVNISKRPRQTVESAPMPPFKEPEEEAPLVTNANREQYVSDYISWLTDRSIRRQYEAFRRGFFTVNSLRSLGLFDATSFQALVEGESQSIINVAELEAVCKYEYGYHANHRVVKEFWSVVRGFDEEKKRLLLEFVTSSSRIPIGGMENVMFYISRHGDDTERLPSSMTCYGRLMLPEYSSRKKLKQKLLLALENSTGFGTL